MISYIVILKCYGHLEVCSDELKNALSGVLFWLTTSSTMTNYRN